MYLMNKSFKKVVRVQETAKIVHAVWTKDNILIYTTYNHFKYLLPNGDKGILKSVSDIQYPVGMIGEAIYSFDIDNKISKTDVNVSECGFKMALSQNDIQAVKSYVKNKMAVEGSAMVSYLNKKNYPAVAMSLTSDIKCKFQLALKSGNLQSAYESATELKKKDCFEKLANDALLQGYYPVMISLIIARRDWLSRESQSI